MSTNLINILLVISVFMVLVLDFLKNSKLLKDKRYLIAGSITNLLFIVFILMFIFNLEGFWIYIALASIALSGFYFQYLKFRLLKEYNITTLIPFILIIIFSLFILLKVI
jgi:hypothetical protein